MKKYGLLLPLLAAAIPLMACMIPPSMMERASWSAPPDYWQSHGRFRQGPEESPSAATMGSATEKAPDYGLLSSDPAMEGLRRPNPLPTPVEEPLYAWDGGVVDGSPQGQVQAQPDASRGVEAPGGRMHVIELYQQALDERDALTEEVQLLRETLQRTSAALEAESTRALDLDTRVAALEESQRELMGDNQSIAARLVTAQIRRLESEKLLLETRITVEQEKMAAAEQAASRLRGGSTPARSSPAPGERH